MTDTVKIRLLGGYALIRGYLTRIDRVCFVSAGPDQRFGDLKAGPTHDPQSAEDNLYSYAISRPPP